MSATQTLSGGQPKSMVDLLNGFVVELRNAAIAAMPLPAITRLK